MTPRDSYLDWNATAPLRPEAASAAADALRLGGNPSSVHRGGRAARQLVERGREAVAALVGAPADGIVFTSGGTEANHLALIGSGRMRLLVSAVEHSSVLQAVPEPKRIPVDGNGLVDLAALAAKLEADTRTALVSVMLANNETGVIQPIAEVAAIAHAHAARSFIAMRCRPPGRSRCRSPRPAPISSPCRGTRSAPPAASARWSLAPGVEVTPLPCAAAARNATAAPAPRRFLAGIAGVRRRRGGIRPCRIRPGRRALRADRLEAALPPDAVVIGAGVARLPQHIRYRHARRPGRDTDHRARPRRGHGQRRRRLLALGKVGPSHVLAAMGVAPEIASATIRVSLGWSTTEADIAHFLDAWTALYRRTRRQAKAA